MSRQRLVLIEDDAVFARVLTASLGRRGFDCQHFATLAALRAELEQLEADYLVLDLYLDGESGLVVLPELRRALPNAKILVLTGFASIATTVQAIKLGADNYLPKPANASQILAALAADTDVSAAVVEQSEPAAEQEVLSVERLQWEHIQAVLAQHEGNISATARALGMHRRTLQRRLAKKPKPA